MKLLLLILTITMWLITGCEQPDGAVGSSVGTDLIGTTRVITVEVDVDTSYVSETSGTGFSPHLYVGSVADFRSSTLISFETQNMPPAWSVESVIAQVKFSYQGSIGDGRGIEVDLKLSDFKWDEQDPPSWDSLSLTPFEPAFETITIADDSGSFDITIPEEWVNAWIVANDTIEIDSLSIPLTILLTQADQSAIQNQLVRFRSRSAIEDTSTSLKPELTLYLFLVDSNGTALPGPDTLSLMPVRDAYIIVNDHVDTGGNLIVGSGVNHQSNIRFDLSELWLANEDFNIVINRATMVLHKVLDDDPILPILPAIWPIKLTDDMGFTLPDSASNAGFATTPTAIDSSMDTLQIIVTLPTVDWASGTELNFGMSLRASTRGIDISRSAFYSSNNPDPALRPRLSIYYTELPR